MKKIILMSLLVILTGCKTVEPIYYHGNYHDVVYSYFNADEITLENQITDINTTILNAESKGKPIAPGIHAHLGMLYFETGNTSEGVKHFEIEKQLYPESIHYVDFLMTSVQGNDNESE